MAGLKDNLSVWGGKEKKVLDLISLEYSSAACSRAD